MRIWLLTDCGEAITAHATEDLAEHYRDKYIEKCLSQSEGTPEELREMIVAYPMGVQDE